MIFSINSNGWAYIYAVWILLIIVSTLSLLVLLNFRLKQSICQTKDIVAQKTFRLQTQLSRSLMMCGLIFSINLLVPLFIVMLCIFGVIKSLYVGIIAFCYIPIYVPIIYLIIMFNIKPYRSFLSRLVKTRALRDSSVHAVEEDVSPATQNRQGNLATEGDRVGSANITKSTTISERTGSATRTRTLS